MLCHAHVTVALTRDGMYAEQKGSRLLGNLKAGAGICPLPCFAGQLLPVCFVISAVSPSPVAVPLLPDQLCRL